MKKILALLLVLVSISVAAQDKKIKDKKAKAPKPVKIVEPKVPKPKLDYSTLDLSKRASDHFMFQYGIAGWSGADNLSTKGFSRSFNTYVLFDFPFKTNPRLSAAIGPGIGTDNIFFENTTIDLNNRAGATFTRDTVNRYKKYKLNTIYAEVPLEIRYSTKPENMNSGWKFALGLKIGTLVDGKTKAKVDLDGAGTGGYIVKEKDKRYFNSTRFAGTARIGYGNLSIFGSYTITDFFKEGLGPDIRPFSVGLALSGF